MDDIKFPNEVAEDADSVMQDLDLEGEEGLPDEPSKSEDELEDLMKDKEGEPAGKVALTFGRFVKLVANHSFLDIVEKNANEDVIISTNLLTDLANAHDRGSERKLPIVFVVGIVIGVAVTYFLLTR